MKEIWKDIKGYKGHYKVSNLGRVKSIKYGKEKYLVFSKNGDRNRAHLSKGCTQKSFYVQTLVMNAFNDNPQKGKYVFPKNGVRGDDRYINLKYSDSSAWIVDYYKSIDVDKRMLNKKDIVSIKKLLEKYYHGLATELAIDYDVSLNTILRIKKGQSYING